MQNYESTNLTNVESFSVLMYRRMIDLCRFHFLHYRFPSSIMSVNTFAYLNLFEVDSASELIQSSN